MSWTVEVGGCFIGCGSSSQIVNGAFDKTGAAVCFGGTSENKAKRPHKNIYVTF